jgi:hypothetical protein
MQPMKPEQKRSALESHPQAQPSDLAEYERLLSERFTRDPDRPQPPAAPDTEAIGVSVDPEARLKELHRILFGAAADTEEQSQQ